MKRQKEQHRSSQEREGATGRPAMAKGGGSTYPFWREGGGAETDSCSSSDGGMDDGRWRRWLDAGRLGRGEVLGCGQRTEDQASD